MTVKVYSMVPYTLNELWGLWTNSADTSAGQYFVSLAWNVVWKATSSTVIAGVSLSQKVYTSDNQTVAQVQLNYIPKSVNALYLCTITWWTITVADEWKYYKLSDSETIDGTTETEVRAYVVGGAWDPASDPVVYPQVQLVTFITATSSVFRII